MLILGIETSCDETAAAVVEDGALVRSSIVASQNDIHAEFAGVVPELASRAHVERITPVIREAIDRAGIARTDLHAIAVGHRPGLIGSLLVGVSAAKALAWSLGLPLIGVDHIQAHLYAGMLGEEQTKRESDEEKTTLDDREQGQYPYTSSLRLPVSASLFPSLGFVVSGGHTSLYLLESWTSLSRLGSTIDDAMGEAFDKAAAILGIPFPGGPNLDRLAAAPGAADRAVELPVSRLSPDSLDFSFSGLKTAVLYAARGVPPSPNPRAEPPTPAPPLTPDRVRDLAASFQRAAVRAAIIKIQRALDMLAAGLHGRPPLPVRTLLVGGGVSANSRLRADLAELASHRHLHLVLPRPPYCIDNAAMIAGLAHHLMLAGHTSDLSLQADPTTAC